MDIKDEIQSTSSEEHEELVTENKTGLYIIYSKWSLARIDKELSFYGLIGLLRIIRDKTGETNRTLALLENDIYDKLSAKGYTNKKSNKGFSIARFKEKAIELPSKGFTRNLFISVPEVFRKDDIKTTDIIEDKLKHLVEWDILPKDCWRINAILKSREKGCISSGCFIVFDNEIDLVTIAKVRMLITDTLWPLVSENTEREQFKCLWAFDSKKKDEDNKLRRKIRSDDEDENSEEDETPKRKIKSEKDKRKIKEDEITPKWKIKSEKDKQKIKEEDDIIPKRKIKAEKDKRKIKEEQKDIIVTSIPKTSQPVEMLYDIVQEEKETVADIVQEEKETVADIVQEEKDIVTEEK